MRLPLRRILYPVVSVDDAYCPLRVAVSCPRCNGSAALAASPVASPVAACFLDSSTRAGVHAITSPPESTRMPTSIDRRSPAVGQLPAIPSARPSRRASPPLVSQGREGLFTPGISVADRSPLSCPQDQSTGPSCLQALLAAASTAAALLDPVGLPPTPSVAPEPTGFRHYGLPPPMASRPSLPWNPTHGGGGCYLHTMIISGPP